jgi:hypothetical protein
MATRPVFPATGASANGRHTSRIRSVDMRGLAPPMSAQMNRYRMPRDLTDMAPICVKTRRRLRF